MTGQTWENSAPLRFKRIIAAAAIVTALVGLLGWAFGVFRGDRLSEAWDRLRLQRLLDPGRTEMTTSDLRFVRYNLFRYGRAGTLRGKDRIYVLAHLGEPQERLTRAEALARERERAFAQGRPEIASAFDELWSYPDAPFLVFFGQDRRVLSVVLAKD